MTLALPTESPLTPPRPTDRGRPAAAGALPRSVCEFGEFADLPPACEVLFAAAGRRDVCLTRAWFELLARHQSRRGGGTLKLLAAGGDGADTSAAALLVGWHRARDRIAFGGRSFTSLDNYYTLSYAPLLAPDGDGLDALAPLAAHLRAASPAYDVIRLQALDPAAPCFAALCDAFVAQGFAVQTYRHFGHWVEPLAGRSFAAYLAARPGALRSTIARKSRRLARAGQIELTIARTPAELAAAWPDYERVYAAGWKAREAAPALVRGFADLLAAAGALRLGLLKLDGRPVAAQLWFVWDGVATVYKLAHDARCDALSPGTVLTARMIEALMAADAVRALGFGPGDDPWKRAWASQDQPRWGLLAMNPQTLRGRLAIARHVWGRKVKRGVLGA